MPGSRSVWPMQVFNLLQPAHPLPANPVQRALSKESQEGRDPVWLLLGSSETATAAYWFSYITTHCSVATPVHPAWPA